MRAILLALLAASGACSASGGAATTSPPPDPVGRERTVQRVGDAPRAPPHTSFDGRSDGCGDVFVFRANTDETEFVTVRVDARDLDLPDGTTRFDLAVPQPHVQVTVDVFAAPPLDEYCTIAPRVDAPAKTSWVAEAGTMTIELRATGDGGRDVSIWLDDLHLIGPEQGVAAVVPRVVIPPVHAGG